MKKNFALIGLVLVMMLWVSCSDRSPHTEALYTCPMPQDSVFSDKPGKCPKCGMDLIPVAQANTIREPGQQIDTLAAFSGYTCPMHPQVHSDTAGTCPICGMALEKVKPPSEAHSVSLNTLLLPANQQVVANVPMVHMVNREEDIEMDTYGFIEYDTRQVGVIAANVEGRIEKLYVSYRYQQIRKGQKVMDIYSPELLTAQQNLLFLEKNDPGNAALITAARSKLRLLGMSDRQLDNVLGSGKPAYTVTVYSPISGHIHESGKQGMQPAAGEGMKDISLTTRELSVKEGMYVQKGQNIFAVYNPDRAWAALNIFAGQAAMVKKGDKVRVLPETSPDEDFRASVSYVEPFFREDSKTLTVRVYFDNAVRRIPIGSQVKATIFAGNRSASWLPEEAVLSLGMDRVVFVHEGESFRARKIETGIVNKHLVQVLAGLSPEEAVAANAQFLVDSESFIKTD